MLGLLLIPDKQYAANLDSLLKVWENHEIEDTIRLEVMQKLIYQGYLFSQPEYAFMLAKMQAALAKKIKHKLWEAKALNNQAITFSVRDDPFNAMDYCRKALKLYEIIQYKKGMANAYNVLAVNYKNLGDVETSLMYHTKSLKINRELDNKSGLANTYNNLAIIYSSQKELSKALEFYEEALSIHQQLGNKEKMSTTYNNIGTIYSDRDDISTAMEYFYKSLDIAMEFNNKRSMRYAYSNIGESFMKMDEFDAAMEFFQKALKVASQTGDKKGISQTNSKLGQLYLKMGNLQKALDYAIEAIQIAQEIGYPEEIRDAAAFLSKCYQEHGEYDKALRYYNMEIKMSDSLLSEATQRLVVQQEMKFDYDRRKLIQQKKQEKIEALAAEEKHRQQTLMYISGSGLLVFLLMGFFIANQFRLARKQKEIIEEQKTSGFQKNKDITDSIRYAKEIQKAIITSEDYMDKILENYFVYYQPLEFVSGDLYWVYELKDGRVMVAVVDCGGHGVSGAFLSLMADDMLNEIVVEQGNKEVNIVLNKMRNKIIESLVDEDTTADKSDRVQISLINLDKKNNKLDFAGAHQNLYILRKGKVLETKGNTFPLGKVDGVQEDFDSHSIDLNKGDIIFLTTDGYLTQSGSDQTSLSNEGFKRCLEDNGSLSFSGLKNSILEDRFVQLDSDNDRPVFYCAEDDVCVFGIEV